MAAALAFIEAITSSITDSRSKLATLASYSKSKDNAELAGQETGTADNFDPAIQVANTSDFSSQLQALQATAESQQTLSAVRRNLDFVDSALKQLRGEVEVLDDLTRTAAAQKQEQAASESERAAHVQWLETELEQSAEQWTELSEKLWLQADQQELIHQLQHQREQSQKLQEAVFAAGSARARDKLAARETAILRTHIGETKAIEILSAAVSTVGDESLGETKEAGAGTEIAALNRLLESRDVELELEREKAKALRSSIHQTSMDNTNRIALIQQNLLTAQKGFAKYFELYKGLDEELKIARDRHEVDSRCLGQLWALNEKLKGEISGLNEKIWMEQRMGELLRVRVSELETLLGPGDAPSQPSLSSETNPAGAKVDAALNGPQTGVGAGVNGRGDTGRSPRADLGKTLAGYQAMLRSREEQVIELQRQLKGLSDAREAEQAAVVQHLKCEGDDKRQLRSELSRERILRAKADRDTLSLQFELRNLHQQLAVRAAIAPAPPTSPVLPPRPARDTPEPPSSSAAPPSPVESLFSGLIGFLSPSPRGDSRHSSPLPTATIASPRGTPSPSLSASPASPKKLRGGSPAGVYGLPSSPTKPPLETIKELSPSDDDSVQTPSPTEDQRPPHSIAESGGREAPSDSKPAEQVAIMFELQQDAGGGGGQREGVYVVQRPQHSSLQRQAADDFLTAQSAGSGYGDPTSPEWRITL